MSEEYIIFGEVIDGPLPNSLRLSVAREMWDALVKRRECKFVEARQINKYDQYAEMLVVDCENDGVPTKNPVGIEYRERLGLLFHSKSDRIPEVRPLRANFPATMHQNHVPNGDPLSLCLYFEPWTAVRATWTPQKHLARIMWWLAETASGTLHRTDQPLEELYFQSPFELILPYDFDEKMANTGNKLVVTEVRGKQNANKVTLVGTMLPLNTTTGINLEFPCIALSLPPIVHGQIEHFPYTLGELHAQLEKRGTSFARPLFDAILSLSQNGHFIKTKAQNMLLILSIPLLREMGGPVERRVAKGFIVENNIANLGVASGALEKVGNDYLVVKLIGTEQKECQNWKDFRINPLEITKSFTQQMARQSCGIQDEGPTGTLAGVGALGSEIFNLWMRSGWGHWTLVDPDYIKPHNLARHSALECHVGISKVEAVKMMADLLMPLQPPKTTAIAEYATNLDNLAVRNSLDMTDIVVDATTTLDFPRMLAARDNVKRALSVFITPSGYGAVMLMEDMKRTIRLDALEAQYYRHIISQPWGRQHLTDNQKPLWAGAGCRDFSAVIQNELITLHGANLARMVRMRISEPEASLNIWHYDPATGSVVANSFKPAAPRTATTNGLQIVWDEGIHKKIRSQREKHLPNETGGVLLGYFDLTLHKVFIVDALAAPSDSREDPSGFVRGIDGLEDAIRQAEQGTANIVGYVGEWHSHPRNYSSNPSGYDIVLLAHLATALEHEGFPALMLIVGEHEENWLMGLTNKHSKSC